MKLYIITVLAVLTQACTADAKPGKEKPYLVSAESKEKVSAEELKQSYAPAAAYIKNGYTAYRITYNTTNTDGNAVVASGALFVPDIKTAVPLLNYNHGTYFPSRERNAPSYLGYGDELSIGKLFSGAGYLVVMPDYIGYGSTKKEKHPYGAYHLIAASVIDMLKAVKEFCAKNEILLSGKNFFSGWSEGAAVALATVKALEEKHKGEFTPTATVLNAGPYYTSGFIDHILEARQPLRYMASYAWILRSYIQLYNINKPFSYYFNEPAASELEAGPERYNADDPQALFTQTFRENYKTGKEIALQKAMQDNDLWNWKPRSKVVFCHGDRDEYVPLFNSEKAYNTMKEKGADVTLQIFKGQTHTSGALGYIQQLFTNFEKAK
ncbi:MAG TPA: lipase family protein [Chitinophagaceae bacterium]|nr:lipase family protein [Chitinophagaceae bacterium]